MKNAQKHIYNYFGIFITNSDLFLENIERFMKFYVKMLKNINYTSFQ